MPSFHHQRVYHFRPDTPDRDVETILKCQIYCAKIEHQNDPFEFAALNALNDKPVELQKFKDSGVACFCRSLTNPLLWSHYADNHRGLVVGYDTGHEFFYGDANGKGKKLFDVKYEDVVPSLERFSETEIATAAVFTKPTCWAYEQEVRLLYSPGNQLLNVPKDSIKEIIFGLQMDGDRIETIKQSFADAGFDVRFGKMRMLNEGYGVTPVWDE